jgi:flavin-dependent dehydrogenase
LFEKAKQSGVEFLVDTEVQEVLFESEKFSIRTDLSEYQADMVIGAHGKRSKLDVKMRRGFMQQKSPYAGIKYHIRTDHPENLISLHNFKGGYCGVSNIEDGKTNLCYLTHSDNLRAFRDIRRMEEEVLYANPLLQYIFRNSDFIFDRPEVINEISFATKSPLDGHVPMAGDAAGMIAPLCGNGMAMAIHSAKMLSELVIPFCKGHISRARLEETYSMRWKNTFGLRLAKGRMIQQLFGNAFVSNAAVNLAIHSKPVANLIVKNTHGKVF